MEKVKVIAKHTLIGDFGIAKAGDELHYHPTDAANLVASGAVEYADKKDHQEAKEKKEVLIKDKEKKEISNPGSITIKEGKKLKS